MKTLVLLFIAALVGGCSGLTGDGDDISPITSKIILQVAETYPQYDAASAPVPTLLLETSEAYECCNYIIVSQIHTLGPVLGVQISGAKLPGHICLTALGPAQAKFVIPGLAEFTHIVVWNRGQTDWYELAVADSTFRLTPEAGSFTEVRDTLVWRFPKMSLVYTCGTRTEDSCLCTRFRDSLLSHINLQPIRIPDEGYWPYPRQSMGYYYDMKSQVFRYNDASEFEIAGDVLAAFKWTMLDGHSGVGIELRNWRNERHASWLIPVSSDPGE